MVYARRETAQALIWGLLSRNSLLQDPECDLALAPVAEWLAKFERIEAPSEYGRLACGEAVVDIANSQEWLEVYKALRSFSPPASGDDPSTDRGGRPVSSDGRRSSDENRSGCKLDAGGCISTGSASVGSVSFKASLWGPKWWVHDLDQWLRKPDCGCCRRVRDCSAESVNS